MPYIQAQEQQLHFKLRRSTRAKRLQIILKASIFEIVAPGRIKNIDILRFALNQKRWMIKALGQKCDKKGIEWPLQFACGERIPLRDHLIPLYVEYGHSLSAIVNHDRLNVIIPTSTKCDIFSQTIQQIIQQCYQKEAMKSIQQTLNHFCPILGRWPKSIHLKQQKSRWGSCGIDGKIYINWLLILAPAAVLEYVVVHELCHLFHRNHGKRFWAKVAKYLPHYDQQEQWLKHNGQHLKPIPVSNERK